MRKFVIHLRNHWPLALSMSLGLLMHSFGSFAGPKAVTSSTPPPIASSTAAPKPTSKPAPSPTPACTNPVAAPAQGGGPSFNSAGGGGGGGSPQAAGGDSVTLAWDSAGDEAAGYVIYWEEDFGDGSKDVGNETTGTLDNLIPGVEYTFTVTAYDEFGKETDPSNEVTYTPPAPEVQPELAVSPPQMSISVDIDDDETVTWEQSKDLVTWEPLTPDPTKTTTTPSPTDPDKTTVTIKVPCSGNQGFFRPVVNVNL